MRSQQGRFRTARRVGFPVVLGLVATGAALAALALVMSRSTVARAAAPPDPTAASPADLILVGGRIYTLDAQKPWAQALAVRGDRILAVGGDREIRALAGPRTRVLDLRGKFALPGFHDAHVHIEATGALLVGTNLLDVHEPRAFVERVRAAAARLPRGSWITRGDWGAYEQWTAGSSGNAGPGDLAVLDTNLVEAGHANPAALLKAQVHYTIAGGRVVFERRAAENRPSGGR
jgi:predicted amidohydrolase YtcJ